MKNKKMSIKNGSVNALVVLGVLVLAIALPVAVFLTQRNQENRSSATVDLTMGICGASTGEYFSVKPESGLCDGGVLIWNDEEAADGDWNWTCKGDPNVADSDNECLAVRE